jgi:hypothetical protein
MMKGSRLSRDFEDEDSGNDDINKIFYNIKLNNRFNNINVLQNHTTQS